ncbi:hypothetical protein [Hymenobacter convexus]|uniref:hypothetical protein n=1 Tax=Hymenobacter sp. CA1UV-4 TaxID=3063782 RepID=UPI0027134AD0|nr:hypothetical protein [Hymenobacter sp. CA1UV-4]MDO7854423.1 hypothetical protein [Hymenobacter sp. CA1UV-4]
MRGTALKKIEATTPLAQLFNAYLGGLHTQETFSVPRVSMHACRVAFATEAQGKTSDISIVWQAQRYYELTVVSNALNQLYWCIEQAAELLTFFYAELDGDLTAYAAANRRHLLNEYGGEDADWHHSGIGDPDAGEGWEVTETTDPARLVDYSLYRQLARFFADPTSQGEYIGTSAPIDYNFFTLVVEQQTDFAPRKMFAAMGGGEMPLYRPDDHGRMVPIPVIDQIEQEINQDVANQALADHFVSVLNGCQHLAERYAHMPPDETVGYRVLHQGLNALLEALPHPE